MEILILAIILAVFFVSKYALKLHTATGLFLASFIAIIVGRGIELPSNFVEGTFGYLDTILALAMGGVFLTFYVENGNLQSILNQLGNRFKGNSIIFLLLVTVLLMIPGLLVGSTLISIVTFGIVIGKFLIDLGFSKNTAVGIVGIGSVIGAVAPPTNILYLFNRSELQWLTLLILFALGLVLVVIMGMGKAKVFQWETKDTQGFKAYIPIVAAAGFVVLKSVLPGTMIDMLGYPLIYLICAVLTIVTGDKINFLLTFKDGVGKVMPIMAILAAGGAMVQVLSTLGVKGYITASLTGMPFISLIVFAAVLVLSIFDSYIAMTIWGGSLMHTLVTTSFYYGGNSYHATFKILALTLVAALGGFIWTNGIYVKPLKESLGVEPKEVLKVIKIPMIIICVVCLIPMFL